MDDRVDAGQRRLSRSAVARALQRRHRDGRAVRPSPAAGQGEADDGADQREGGGDADRGREAVENA